MRLIDADKLIEFLDSERKSGLALHDFSMVGSYKNAINFVENMPTAYDIGKVVEELEEQKHMIALDWDDADLYKEAINDAIEIVKQGGVSDDVCQWKLEDEESNLYATGCEQKHLVFYETPKENGYKFCPYCGKKIKVVE